MDFYRRLYLTYQNEDHDTVDKIIEDHYRRGNIEGIWGCYPAPESGFEIMAITCYLEEDFITIKDELKNNGVALR